MEKENKDIKKKKVKKCENFEDALGELESVAKELESGELGLDDAIARYEEGITYARFCQKKLEEAERKIEILQKGRDGTVESSGIRVKDDTGEIEDDHDVQGSLL
ncbi:MAG: exodeoxyribonuclease VII small subunit [Spirochaetota bacterium]